MKNKAATTRPSSDSPSRTPTGTQLCASASISTTETKWKKNAMPPTWTQTLRHRSLLVKHGGKGGDAAPA